MTPDRNVLDIKVLERKERKCDSRTVSRGFNVRPYLRTVMGNDNRKLRNPRNCKHRKPHFLDRPDRKELAMGVAFVL
jgi:hypothetical protein